MTHFNSYMNSSAYALPQLSRLSHCGFVSLYENIVTKEKSLHASIAIKKGYVFASCEASAILPAPDKYTVQVADNTHIILSPAFLQFLNHSCNPNIFFDTATMELSALRDIMAGDEFSFFYPSTEWAMAAPFQCFCGAANCLSHIQGASYLPQEIINDYKFTDFIMQKLHNTYLQKV